MQKVRVAVVWLTRIQEECLLLGSIQSLRRRYDQISNKIVEAREIEKVKPGLNVLLTFTDP
jgi:hypothetical protein